MHRVIEIGLMSMLRVRACFMLARMRTPSSLVRERERETKRERERDKERETKRESEKEGERVFIF
jgi:hypothetical protein